MQVYYKNSWGNVCFNSSFTKSSADVVCHQLGFTSASSFSSAGKARFGLDPNPPLLHNVACDTSNLLVMLQCAYNDSNPVCAHSDDVTVTCNSDKLWDTPFDAMVRLVDGQFVTEGRVEIYCNEKWGTVCETSDHTDFANVICQQLGYTNVVDWDDLPISDNSTQPIWMKDVDCDLSKTCVAFCQTCPSSLDDAISSCNHTQDMTVKCTYDTSAGNRNHEINTCKYANEALGLAAAIIATIVIFSICGFSIIVVLIVTVPWCVCCCLGVGVGATARTRKSVNYANFN